MKKRYRFLTGTLALVFIATFMLPFILYSPQVDASTNGYTRTNAVSWVRAKMNKTVSGFAGYALDVNNISISTSPETADRYYFNSSIAFVSGYVEALGQSSFWFGSVRDGSTSASYIPVGWDYVTSNYQPGDIVCFKKNLEIISGFSTIETHDYSSFAVVLSVSGSGILVAEQGDRSQRRPYVVGTWHLLNEVAIGVRPDFVDAPSQDTSLAGWQKMGSEWYYFLSNGNPATGLRTINGKLYFFSNTGVLYKGWKKLNGKWYNFTLNGARTGLQTINGNKYYFSSNGVLQTGWKKCGNYWYYFTMSGAVTGWYTISGNRYYFRDNCTLVTGWLVLGGKRYYIKSNGGILRNGSYYIGGRYYTFNSSGICTNY